MNEFLLVHRSQTGSDLCRDELANRLRGVLAQDGAVRYETEAALSRCPSPVFVNKPQFPGRAPFE
jgi:hypothetical protein